MGFRSTLLAGTFFGLALLPVGAVAAPGDDACRFCAAGPECSTGICVADEGGRHQWCSSTCRGNGDCLLGYVCEGADAGVDGFCAPASGTCAGQCGTRYDCTPGYACDAGVCEAEGTLNARCELTGFCRDCLACVGTSEEAYCRTCCGGETSGGLCQGCPNTATACGTTPQPTQCLALSNGRDAVCAPSTTNGSCQACGNSTDCWPGLECVGGRCHAPCNPLHPGNCAACYAIGATAGWCACPDEIAQTNYACGPIASGSGGFVACVNAELCLDSPPTCHARCDQLGQACATGGTCQLVDGQQVCSTRGAPGGRCEPCADGVCADGYTCRAGRCYEACSTLFQTCAGCVATSGNDGFCACDDQIVGPGQPCGAFDGGAVAACAPGGACTDGLCRTVCDPQRLSSCPATDECRLVGAKYVCLPRPAPDAGTPADGGPGGGATGGCGCSSTEAALTAAALLLLAARRRRTTGGAPRRP